MKRPKTHQRKGIHDINWLEQMIQLVVVVISITLAFMVNRWYESHKNRQLELKYLQSFYSQVIQDQSQIDTLIAESTTKLENHDKLFQFLDQNPVQWDSLLHLFADMLKFTPFQPNLTTYEAITSSGNFNLIRNYHLQENLIQYYQGLERKKYIDAIFDSYLNQFIIPFAFENVDFTRHRFVNEKSMNIFKFRNLTMGYYNLLQQNIIFYKQMQNNGKELQELLANELPPNRF